MAVRTNVGKVASAIEAGRIAYDKIDFGPVADPSLQFMEGSTSDWTQVNGRPDKFIAGVHKWGSVTNFKVAK